MQNEINSIKLVDEAIEFSKTDAYREHMKIIVHLYLRRFQNSHGLLRKSYKDG